MFTNYKDLIESINKKQADKFPELTGMKGFITPSVINNFTIDKPNGSTEYFLKEYDPNKTLEENLSDVDACGNAYDLINWFESNYDSATSKSTEGYFVTAYAEKCDGVFPFITIGGSGIYIISTTTGGTILEGSQKPLAKDYILCSISNRHQKK